MQSTKKIVIFFDQRNVRKVCIDDFALKRGQRYGTIMIDLETHIVVDILDSRDCEKVSDWLKGYPNIEIISRDGSIGYRKAIDEAFGDVIQISDGFHLIKGLLDGCKEYIQERFGTSIVIEGCESEEQSDATEEIKGKMLSEKEESKLRLAEKIR